MSESIISDESNTFSITESLRKVCLIASKKAQRELAGLDVPFVYEEDGIVYREFRGRKTVVKQLARERVFVPKRFCI